MIAESFEAQGRGDHKATLEFYVDELVSLPPGMPIINGKDWMRIAEEEESKYKISTEHTVTHVGIADSGELGYVVASYERVIESSEGTTKDKGKFHCTLKKTEKGWKYLVQSWNNDS